MSKTGKSSLWKRITAMLAIAGMLQSLIVPTGKIAASDEGEIATNYIVQINETVTDGFTHPGVGLTKSRLETIRSMVIAKKEPWYSYYNAMTVSSSASKTVTSSNQSSADPTKPASDAFNSQGFNSRFIADGLKAYTQALMYYITGDVTYRANAMHIIRIWSQMNPNKYVYFNDSHIHTGIPLNRMVAAAEILRYTSSPNPELAWTEKDTTDFTNNLVTPVIENFLHDNNRFMNQHNYPLLGAMAGYIFTSNTERYEEAVEWFTVNTTAKNQGFNGSVKQLFRLIDSNAVTGEAVNPPVVQHVEMGRDQAHGGGDLTNAVIISRMLLAQGTKVDPVLGTVSTGADAVGPYEFLKDRILDAANFFWQYMLGYDTSWIPVVSSTGKDGSAKGIYRTFSDSYRGRMTTANFWDLYYYYTYEKGVDLSEKAPFYYEAFTKRIPSNYYHQGSLKQNWDNVDGGGDFWLYLPAEAAAEGATMLPKEQLDPALVELEDRYTVFDSNSEKKQEGNTTYINVKATERGNRLVFQNLSYADRSGSRLIGLKFRTDGKATVTLSKEQNSTPYHTLTLPDTHGEWKYITFDMGISHVTYGQLDNDYNLLYLNVTGNGTTVDLDHLNVLAGQQLTPPSFVLGNETMDIVTVAGTPLTIDFSATDSSGGDTLSYEITDPPPGAALQQNTGIFTWHTAEPGSYSFVVVASDGATVATKNVHVVVAIDRNAAIQTAISSYDEQTKYTSSTLNHFHEAYNQALAQLQTATDEQFNEQLLVLKQATTNLELLTPPLLDGSMDYTGIVTSSFGSSISMLVDGNNNTYPVYTLAPYPDLYHILDFGPNYKGSAERFGLQSRMNFVDRMAGSAIFGSNDRVNWTRLTSEETAFTDEMAMLEVDPSLRQEQYRFIKIQMLHPQPDVLFGTIGNMLELGEFRIYGERHESLNKLEVVSIGSEQAVQHRIGIGDQAKVTFQSSEPILDVQVTIQGQEAQVESTDQLHWTATATMDNTAVTGNVSFNIRYKTADDVAAEPVIFTTDDSILYLVNSSDSIQVGKLATVVASDDQIGGAVPKDKVGYALFDGNLTNFGDLATGAGSYYMIDFGENAKVKLSDMMLMPRPSFPGRMNGLVIQGSNDKTSWTDLTRPASGTKEGQWTYIGSHELLDGGYYRYLKLFNSTNWFGNVSEVEFYGDYQYDSLDSRVVASDGYTRGSYYLYQKEVQRIKKAFQQPGADKKGLLQQLLAAEQKLVSLEALIGDRIEIAPSMVAASTSVWGTGASKETNGWYAFDGNTNTYTDTIANPSWIDIDLGEGQSASLGSLRFYPRGGKDDLIRRMNGAMLQGSSDGVNYSTLYTISGVNKADWFQARITDETEYAYYRYYAPTGSANIAELELYRKTLDRTLLEVLVNEVDELDEEQYSAESYAAVQQALSDAMNVQHNENATQEQINETTQILKQAMEHLVSNKSIVSLQSAVVTTTAGVAPLLPDTVMAAYSDESTENVEVSWQQMDPVQYESPGSFSVTGAVYGTELPAMANVTVLEAGITLNPPAHVRAMEITSSAIKLGWNPPEGSAAIEGYDILQNGKLVATVSRETLEYLVTPLSANTTYVFQISAFDSAGHRADSERLSLTTTNTPSSGNPGTGGDGGAGTNLGSTSNENTNGKDLTVQSDSLESQATVSGARIAVSSTVENGKMRAELTMEMLNQALRHAQTNQERVLTIQLGHPNDEAAAVSGIALELPAQAWQAMKRQGMERVLLESPLLTLELRLDEVSLTSYGDKLLISAVSAAPTNPVGADSGLIQEKKRITIQLLVDGKEIGVGTNTSLRTSSIRIPYALMAGERPGAIVAAQVNSEGKLDILRNSLYDAKTGELSFPVNGWGHYAIVLNQPSFSDLDKHDWAKDGITALAARNIVAGVDSQHFAPEKPISRTEFVKLMMEAYDLVKPSHEPTFTDVKSGKWYSDAVASAQDLKIVMGYKDGSFGLNQPITRQEMAVISIRLLTAAGIEPIHNQTVLPFSDQSDIAGYAAEAVAAMSGAGWLRGRGGNQFLPHAQASRSEAAVMIARMLGLS
ncbi:S-layer homology domain-containing protein [Paenibacillus silvae]|uniref:S-layer homology domain-containing protein n=1 Tax=Paenibacillus silvae TaxID=1325358 RepID=UPI0025A17CB3|nr:S-layer homology domain-containing protein [Paenibacillus silvae]MDM5277463.1 S-layer homology domain-containing protein [Paenibacillus silvae]